MAVYGQCYPDSLRTPWEAGMPSLMLLCACPRCKSAEGKFPLSNILWLAGSHGGLMYWFARAVLCSWNSVLVNWKYSLLVKQLLVRVFCGPTWAWSNFEYHSMDLLEILALKWGIFRGRCVQCNYHCITFAMKMQISIQNLCRSLFQYFHYHLKFLNAFWWQTFTRPLLLHERVLTARVAC